MVIVPFSEMMGPADTKIHCHILHGHYPAVGLYFSNNGITVCLYFSAIHNLGVDHSINLEFEPISDDADSHAARAGESRNDISG